MTKHEQPTPLGPLPSEDALLGMHHDMCSLLGTILCNAELIQQGILQGPDLNTGVARIHAAALRARDLLGPQPPLE